MEERTRERQEKDSAKEWSMLYFRQSVKNSFKTYRI